MELQLIKKPYLISFSGSAVPFSFAVSPYTNADAAQDIRVQVFLLIEKAFGSNVYTEEYSEEIYPGDKGQVNIELQSVIDPFLTWFIPNIKANIPEVATGQFCRYKVQYKLIKNNELVGDVVTTSPFIAIKGGMSYPLWRPVWFFQNHMLNLLFLGIVDEYITAFTDEKKFLYYIMQPLPDSIEDIIIPDPVDSEDYRITYTVTGNNGIEYSKFSVLTELYQYGRILCFPSGYDQNNLGDLLPAGVLPISYNVVLTWNRSAGGIIYPLTKATAIYKIDHRIFYNTSDLFYFTSSGNLNTRRMLGKLDYEAEYEKQDAERITTPDYFINAVPNATVVSLKSEETQRTKGSTGFLTASQAEQLRDLFLSEIKLQLKYDNFIPITVDNTKVAFYANRDSLISLQVEWSDAYSSPWYTNPLLVPDYSSLTCPAVESFKVKQISRDILQISWALQTPYDYAEVNINGEIFFYRGNTGTINQAFTNTAPTDDEVDIDVKIRTICNPYSNPQNKGPYTTITITIKENLLPVASNDTYTVPGGLTAAIPLVGSVLDNDFDPDGAAIEVVAVTSVATTGGGTISITSAGAVTYLPASPSFTGIDTYVYSMRKVGEVTAVTATITINVLTTLNNVFAKLIVKNTYTTFIFGTATPPFPPPTIGSRTFGEAWISYYSNPQGTIPLDITPLALTILYKSVRVDNFPTPGTSTTNLSVAGAGTTQKVFTGLLSERITGGFSPSSFDYTLSLRPGTGYIII